MNVLFLGSRASPLVSYLEASGDAVTVTAELLTPDSAQPYDFIVSHGYRHILAPPVLDHFGERAVNLHISYLPWNRGAHPNVWSALEGTPSGVTVHRIDEGVDTGDVVAQSRVDIGDSETLRSSWATLGREVEDLFRSLWPDIRAGRATSQPQHGAGSFHRVADLQRVRHLLTKGWDTPVGDLRAAGWKGG
jgi:methionyl-tRNA formyltransferase